MATRVTLIVEGVSPDRLARLFEFAESRENMAQSPHNPNNPRSVVRILNVSAETGSLGLLRLTVEVFIEPEHHSGTTFGLASDTLASHGRSNELIMTPRAYYDKIAEILGLF